MYSWKATKDTLRRVRWFNLAILTVSPGIWIYGSRTTPLRTETLLWSIAYYVFTMIGAYLCTGRKARDTNAHSSRYHGRLVQANLPGRSTLITLSTGYHRLWSHRSYNASRILQYLLIVMGASAVQGSVYWWARGHRSHHRYTDTPLDPYNAKRGFLYSHIGWMLIKPTVRPGHADISDLQKNDIVQWQHRHYFALIAAVGYALPTVVAGLGWGDWWGGWFYAAMMRITLAHHVSGSRSHKERDTH